MSKSLGNVVTPTDILSGRFTALGAKPTAGGKQGQKQTGGGGSGGLGADVLRWWAASCDFSTDCGLGMTAITTTVEHVRKLRNTLRFLLGVLEGWQPEGVGSSQEGPTKPCGSLLDAWSAPIPIILHGPEFAELSLLDRAMLQRLAVFHADILSSYEQLVSSLVLGPSAISTCSCTLCSTCSLSCASSNV